MKNLNQKGGKYELLVDVEEFDVERSSKFVAAHKSFRTQYSIRSFPNAFKTALTSRAVSSFHFEAEENSKRGGVERGETDILVH